MSHAAYRTAVATIAANELEGEDVEGRISYLAAQAGIDRANVRQDVTELQQD